MWLWSLSSAAAAGLLNVTEKPLMIYFYQTGSGGGVEVTFGA